MDTKKIDTKQFVVLLFNSTIVYVFSYLFVYFIYQLITALMAAEYNIRTLLTFYKLNFLTPDNSFRWYADSALTIFGAAPLICALIAFISIMLYQKSIQTTSLFKLFFLWTTIHSINRIFGSYAIGTIFFQYDSNLIVDWMYVGLEIKIILVAISVILLYIIGNYTTGPVLFSANNFTLINKINRKNFIYSQLLFPWLFGSIIIFLFFLPYIPLRENLINITIFLMIIPIMLRYKKIMTPQIDDDIPDYKISWRFIVYFFILLAGFRFAFRNGIRFGSETEKVTDLLGLIIFIAVIIIFAIVHYVLSRKRKRREFEEIIKESLKSVEN